MKEKVDLQTQQVTFLTALSKAQRESEGRRVTLDTAVRAMPHSDRMRGRIGRLIMPDLRIAETNGAFEMHKLLASGTYPKNFFRVHNLIATLGPIDNVRPALIDTEPIATDLIEGSQYSGQYADYTLYGCTEAGLSFIIAAAAVVEFQSRENEPYDTQIAS